MFDVILVKITKSDDMSIYIHVDIYVCYYETRGACTAGETAVPTRYSGKTPTDCHSYPKS